MVITAIPEGLLMTSIVKSIRLTVGLVLLALLLSVSLYNLVTGRLLKPIDNLLQVSEALASGDLSKRANVVRKDEIGSISTSLNKVADKMQFLIHNLEMMVEERTDALHQTNATLEENKNQLQLILDSTAEAIYGIDLYGKCIFCNRSCMQQLRYEDQSKLLGKNMHEQIHYRRADGTTLAD